MNSVVIEHVNISELPEVWRARLGQPSGNRVTVRIEEESAVDNNAVQSSYANPLFGLRRDRKEMSDVAAYVQQLRSARF